jgi:hypothetical protein
MKMFIGFFNAAASGYFSLKQFFWLTPAKHSVPQSYPTANHVTLLCIELLIVTSFV